MTQRLGAAVRRRAEALRVGLVVGLLLGLAVLAALAVLLALVGTLLLERRRRSGDPCCRCPSTACAQPAFSRER